MNGVHDLGGMMNFGPVDPEPEATEPLFHAAWERTVLAMNLSAPRRWNIDMSRSARETLPPADYLSSSYYEIWLKGLEKLLVAHDLVSRDELATGHALSPPADVSPLSPADAVRIVATGAPTIRPHDVPARFSVGDAVRTLNLTPTGHTRLPRYARGRRGVIELVHGAHVFADANALGRGPDPQWLYTVVFDGRELWGDDADAATSVSIDAWEPYLAAL